VNKEIKVLIENYFKNRSLVESQIRSYEYFIDYEMQRIVDEIKVIEPTIIPPNVDEIKIMLGKIRIGEPEVTEAEGSVRKLYPQEARLRKLTYAAKIYLTFNTYINGKLSESVERHIGMMPIMLKSKYCLLRNLSFDELIEKGEDPYEPGGYFIINGTERVLVAVEDLASNHFLVEYSSTSGYVGRIFSTYGSLKIPTLIEKSRDGIIHVSFGRIKKIPFIFLVKALGMTNDQEIMQSISQGYEFSELITNLYEGAGIVDPKEAMDRIAKEIHLTQSKDVRIERVSQIIDNLFLPHLGIHEADRRYKALNLCKMIRKYLLVSKGYLPCDDKDHYKNKRIRLAGDLLADLFRVGLRTLVNDILYNFQRIVKRGKLPSMNVIVRNKLLTSRIYSSMATGNWVGERTGISQRIQRLNYLEMLSHLQRVISPLSSTQENFEARELHGTHLGRLCPVETPEGTNIGLKKNLAILAEVSEESNEKELINKMKKIGLKLVI